MEIKKVGFTPKEISREIEVIANNNTQIFSFLESIILKCKSFVELTEVLGQETEEKRQKIISLVIAIRLLEISEASLLLMKNGMSNDANTMFRVFLDAYFIFANVCTDVTFIANYFKSDTAARLKLANSAEKHGSTLFKRINEYATQEIKIELKERIKEENIQAFNSYTYADNVGCTEIYDSMYRLMSTNLHSTPRSLMKYIEEDHEGNIVKIKYYPIEGEIPGRADDFSHFLIKVYSGLKETFGCLNEDEIKELSQELAEIKIKTT